MKKLTNKIIESLKNNPDVWDMSRHDICINKKPSVCIWTSNGPFWDLTLNDTEFRIGGWCNRYRLRRAIRKFRKDKIISILEK